MRYDQSSRGVHSEGPTRSSVYGGNFSFCLVRRLFSCYQNMYPGTCLPFSLCLPVLRHPLRLRRIAPLLLPSC